MKQVTQAVAVVFAAALLSLVTIPASIAGAEQLPDGKKIEKLLKEAHSKYKGDKSGANADYIPVLAEVPSELFGIALVTPDGKVYHAGDVDHEFSIQSISKVFALAKVLQVKGEDAVENGVGVDPTGQVFNSIHAVEQHKGHEMNAFVNPGAIATTSMIPGSSADEVWSKIVDIHSDFAGRPLTVNQTVYKSESDTNQRNRAIGMLMHAYGLIEDNPEQATDLYTKQCSLNVNAKDLAVMAGTLANGGVNPLTKKKVIDQDHVKEVLSVMAVAGLYDDAGKWLFKTGLPAKSGVGGGIIAVSPGKFGIAAFSPRLDEAGNSVRAQKAIEFVSNELGGNPFDVKPNSSGS